METKARNPRPFGQENSIQFDVHLYIYIIDKKWKFRKLKLKIQNEFQTRGGRERGSTFDVRS